ncbi:c-type cytochrome [Rhodoferax sp.]|uniref:c-type cytochrome n=1 Tax=Rhodoferax sp. TaxID=50421 RepID=UPI002841D23F|nr:c-type cytochrome [Rhodoferax sp.]MDR3368400.1 c-type cytochrome [Rhodoferax sp.]
MINFSKKSKLSLLILGFSSFFLASAHAAGKTGQAVVQEVCAACHMTGKDGAPIIGDTAAWLPRETNGLAKLTEHAIEGFNKMPAHGGQPNLSDLEMSRAVAFMVSAGKAVDPTKPYASPTSITAEQLVRTRCVVCHENAKTGAPRLGDFPAWKPRLAKGIEVLVQSAISGHKGMPSRGGMASLSDSEIRGAVTYVVVQSATYKPVP